MIKKYKVKYKVEKIYNVEVEIEDPSSSIDERNDLIYEIITEDYEVGTVGNDLADETYSIEKVEEVDDKNF